MKYFIKNVLLLNVYFGVRLQSVTKSNSSKTVRVDHAGVGKMQNIYLRENGLRNYC